MTYPISQTLTANVCGDVLYYSFPSFDHLGFIKHGFSTRLGGVSQPPFDSMNLGFNRGDDDEAVRENYRRICAAIGVQDTDVVLSAQTHTTNIYKATAADRGRGITYPRGYTDVDGLVTNEPGVVLCTHYADCVPLFFVDPVKRAVATSHGGWRGTVGGIAQRTVERMTAEYGSRPADILVGIGPSIGKCCFEVDAPVLDAFLCLDFFDADCYIDDGNGKYRIDLWEVNRRYALRAGVKVQNITVTDICTKCHPDVLWSHRVCGITRGSLAAFIAIAE